MVLSTSKFVKRLAVTNDKLVHLSDAQTIRRVQLILLSMAKDIIEVCEAENINYLLVGGSALGAVRHGGFIPWDDDIDIGILGSQFERFRKAFSEKYGDKYWIHTCETPGYGYPVNHIRLKNSIFRLMDDFDSDECGFCIDIFRIENTYDNAILRTLHGILCMGMGFLNSCRGFYRKREPLMILADGDQSALRSFRIKIRIGKLLSFLPVEKWAAWTQKCYGLCKNNHSVYVCSPAGCKHFFGEIYVRSEFVETIKMNFEGYQWSIMKEYDKFLTQMFGDYMKIPEENEREEHVLLELVFPEEQR